MAKASARRTARSGTYVVKAGESRPAQVVSKQGGRSSRPSGADRRAARALLRSKRG